MTLFTHVAPHPDPLVLGLCDQLATPADDVFATDVVAVPTRGIERWLRQRIASEFAVRGIADGICANIEFPSPRNLIRRALLEVPALSETILTWQGRDLVANVITAIDSNIDEPWMRMLARYLRTDDRDTKSPSRLSAARKVAGLYSTYARRRPEMIRAWAAGDDLGADQQALPNGDSWQPELWRSLREQVGVAALPELMPGALDPIRLGTVELDLPDRLAVYGLTATDPLDFEVLIALAEQRDVHIYILHPSPVLWNTTAGANGLTTMPSRADDTSEQLVAHPLLQVWGRDSRELQIVTASSGLSAEPADHAPGRETSLLSALQHDIRANRPPHVEPELGDGLSSATDRSIQIHACHGDRRQVEVLRDAILHELDADTTLEPRDIVIMTPDLGTFAPLMEAAFPSSDARSKDGLPDLRVRVGDRSPSSTNPLIRFTATLMSIADDRLEAVVVRELVGRQVVQQRFGFEPETAGELISLIDDATIAWGLDATERESWGAGSSAERTWTRGLDRILSGVFFADDPLRIIGSTVPMDGVEAQDAATAGLLANLVDRLAAARYVLDQGRPMSQWAMAISSSVKLLAIPAWGDEWQLDQLERLLAETFPVPEALDTAKVDPVVTLAEARSAISSWTDERPSPLHFRTGDVTVCTLAPMRSVPYRLVCLLGMDESRFPRGSRADGDDLLLRHEIVGDRSRSVEDRQLLLDAVMATGQTLIITYSGRDELTNADLAPSVPVAELNDTLAEMVGANAVEKLVTTHPLQAFSSDNFIPGRLGIPGPWAYDRLHLDAANAVLARDVDTPPEDHDWPPWIAPDPLHLDDLIAFLEHPSKRFVRERLGFTIPSPSERADDTLPADLAGLAAWSVTNRLLAGFMDGHDLDEVVAREKASDMLPPGDLGVDDLAKEVASASELWSAAREIGYRPESERRLSGTVDLGESTLEGSVPADPGRGHVVFVTPSRLRGKHRLRAYTQIAFLSAIDPTRPWTAQLIGKRASGAGYMRITIGPLGDSPQHREQIAIEILANLIDLYGAGMDHPLPFPCETAFAWQTALRKGRSAALQAAEKKWKLDVFSPESEDPANLMLLAHLPTVEELLDAGLETVAARLWDPILAVSREVKL